MYVLQQFKATQTNCKPIIFCNAESQRLTEIFFVLPGTNRSFPHGTTNLRPITFQNHAQLQFAA